MEWESKEIEENMSLLIGLAKNCVPITLGSLLNTFEDMKREYYTSYYERKYDGISTTKENKRIYMEALCPYDNKKFRYVIHFLDVNDMYEQKTCKLTDDILIVEVIALGSGAERNIFINRKYYYEPFENDYTIEINEKIQK